MEVKLWKELDDQQAEKASGGEGIGQANSEDNQIVREIAQLYGYQNINKAYKDGFFYPSYPGEQGYGPNDNNRETSPFGEAKANWINNYLKP